MLMMLVPNIQRVIIKAAPIEKLSSGVIIPGQLKPGENLLFGIIVHPGGTKFVKGQGVFYSEYSAAALLDVKEMVDKTKSYGDAQKEDLYVVAEDDIMAYYDDAKEIRTTAQKD